jgi:glutamate synthase (NADPH/NADH) large chain
MQRSHTSGSCGVGFVCTIGGEKSHQIVQWGVEAVTNLTHRGAVGADGKSGDGAGVLTQIPEKLFLKKVEKTEHLFPTSGNLAVGVFFFYGDIEQKVEEVLKRSGATVLGWRDVPTNDRALGESALLTKPRIRHILLDTEGIEQDKKEITLFLARRIIEKHYGSQVYVSSLSSRTIVYKGLLIAPNLGEFYPDLNDPDFESSFCVFHQRFSTNTLPDWKIAQPFRVLAHNGEINTIQGNRNCPVRR